MGPHYPVVFILGVAAGYLFPKFIRAVLDNDLVGILSDCAVAELRAHLPHRFRGAWKSWGSLAGAGICEAAAAMVSLLFHNSSYDNLAALGFLLIVGGCARHFGALAGILGSLSAAGTFALFLFEPVGKLSVSDPSDQIALAVVIVGGVLLSYYLASGPRGRAHRRCRSEPLTSDFGRAGSHLREISRISGNSRTPESTASVRQP